MKANEFVKKFGWDEVISQLKKTQDNVVVMWLGSQSNDYALVKDLKRLVESHVLVLEWKLPEDDEIGLDGANLYLDYYAHYTSDEEKAKLDRLKQAIADVESCQ